MNNHAHAFQAQAAVNADARSRPLRLWPSIAGLAGLMLAAGLVYLWYFLPMPQQTVRPKVGTAITAVFANGTVESTIMLPVAPRVGARLVALSADEPQIVAKGQILARLESEDLAGNIAQLQAQADFARNDYRRYERLIAADAVARQTYDHALSTWQSAEAALRQAKAQAGFMTLAAPGKCRVISRDGEIGEFIAANTPLFWLACDPTLRISAQVDEEDIRLVKPGQRVVIRADAFPGRNFEGAVDQVTPRGDPVGRSYRVRIALPAGTPLQIGMTADTNIVIRQSEHALLLPDAAVANGKVWLLDGTQLRQRTVTIGVRSADKVEIVKGLSADDVVLANGQAGPRPQGLRGFFGRP